MLSYPPNAYHKFNVIDVMSMLSIQSMGANVHTSEPTDAGNPLSSDVSRVGWRSLLEFMYEEGIPQPPNGLRIPVQQRLVSSGQWCRCVSLQLLSYASVRLRHQ